MLKIVKTNFSNGHLRIGGKPCPSQDPVPATSSGLLRHGIRQFVSSNSRLVWSKRNFASVHVAEGKYESELR